MSERNDQGEFVGLTGKEMDALLAIRDVALRELVAEAWMYSGDTTQPEDKTELKK